MKFHKVVAGIGGLAIAGGIALGASVALPSVAQAAPGGNGGGKWQKLLGHERPLR